MKVKPTYEELELEIKKLSEKINRQSEIENQYRNLVDSTSDSLYLVDEAGRYLFMNSNHARRMNLPLENIIGHSYGEFHSPQQGKEFAENVREVYASGNYIKDEHQSPRDNSYFLRTFSPVRKSSGNGKVFAVSVVSKDITERRRAEEALQKSEEKYRLLIENSNEAIFIIADGKINFANSRAEQMLGYSREDLKLISFINLVLAEDREMVYDRQKSTLTEKNSASNYGFRIFNKEGTDTLGGN